MRELSEAARCAKMIRGDLKTVYPETKFTVQCSNYSMGNSVYVSWIDGPRFEDVYEMLEKYKVGHFDGMIDCYEYSNRRNDIPQTKYLICQRHSR